MKKQSGFTLIELLLVLAIIGIISAIAIPALLAQRSRARDTTARGNGGNVLAEIVAAYDRYRDTVGQVNTLADFNDNIVGGTAATSRVPMLYTSSNPWKTAGALTGYRLPAIAETNNIGAAVRGVAAVGNQGQVQLGFLPSGVDVFPVVSTGVYLSATFKDETNTDTHVFVKVTNLD